MAALPSHESRPRVLLVDDESLVLRSYELTLCALDYAFLFAEGPEAGLRCLEEGGADVVIADFFMPGMTGDEFLARVCERWSDTVRILITGCADIEDVGKAVRRGGIFRLLTKPCDADKLRQAVIDGVEQCRRERERRKRAEQLQLSLQSYRMVFQSAFDPMMVTDLEGNLIEANEAFLRARGQGSLLAFGPRALLGPREGAAHLPDILAAVQREGYWSDEIYAKATDSHALLSISRVSDEQGQPFALVAVEKDITARRRLERETRAAQYEVILSLAKLAEYRDPETFAHLERMRLYSRLLAEELSKMARYKEMVDDAYIEAIYVSSPLHDVGKVGIPDSILLKPAQLTPDEWRVMQLHTRIGEKILAGTGHSLTEKSWLSMARVIAVQHHERFDGRGYPAGLQGEAIDFAARIVTLADAYDAITSRRVYKEASSGDVARQRIIDDTGRHFDPDVVAAFLAREEEFSSVRQRYQEPQRERELDLRDPTSILSHIEWLLQSDVPSTEP